jgi:hypothetical protein
MGFIELRAGPFGGRNAPHNDAFPPMLTPLLYLPDRAKPELPPNVRVPILTCSYLHRSHGIYDFVEVQEGSVKNAEYCGIKRVQDECNWLRALVIDPRLAGDRDGPRIAPSALLPLEQARAKKEAALPRYRRWIQEELEADDIGDEEAWEIFAYRTLGDLDWAAVGSPTHLDSVRGILRDFFDIAIPLGYP